VSSQGLVIAEDYYRDVLLNKVTSETEWLDVGCGWQLVREWLPNGALDQLVLSKRARRLVGIDAVSEDIERNPYLHEKIVGDICNLPFSDATFNLVTAQMVVEHLERPGDFLMEIKRVLRPGGRLIFLTPNYLNYQIFAASLLPDPLKKALVRFFEGRPENDVFKTYYRMNTRNGVREMARQSGFVVEKIHMLHADWEFRRIRPLYWVERALHRILDLEAYSQFRSDILAILINEG
jgi:ubiquinone/menaquinone biosynthesis C-methylase UbiE